MQITSKQRRQWIKESHLSHICSTLCFLYGVNAIHCLCTINHPLQFHHRDPGIVGLITRHTDKDSEDQQGSKDQQDQQGSKDQQDSQDSVKPIYYGLIADGHHTLRNAIRIAYRSNKKGSIIVHLF